MSLWSRAGDGVEGGRGANPGKTVPTVAFILM